MKQLSRWLAALFVAAPLIVEAGPVTVSQTVTKDVVVPFGTDFTLFGFGPGGWSAAFPFTQASQIQSITWTFDSNAPEFTDQSLWPTNPAGVPGVEMGVLDDSNVRHAFVSFVPGNATFSMTPGADFDLVRNLVVDGAVIASLAAFYNYAGPGFSEGIELLGTSTLTLTLTGNVPDRPLPEPASLALLAAAAIGSAASIRRGRARR